MYFQHIPKIKTIHLDYKKELKAGRITPTQEFIVDQNEPAQKNKGFGKTLKFKDNPELQFVDMRYMEEYKIPKPNHSKLR